MLLIMGMQFMVQGCHGIGKTENLDIPFFRQEEPREFGKNIKNLF